MHVLRVLCSRVLPCRCLVGVYETYGGEAIVIIDEPDRACREQSHRLGQVIGVQPDSSRAVRPATGAATATPRQRSGSLR